MAPPRFHSLIALIHSDCSRLQSIARTIAPYGPWVSGVVRYRLGGLDAVGADCMRFLGIPPAEIPRAGRGENSWGHLPASPPSAIWELMGTGFSECHLPGSPRGEQKKGKALALPSIPPPLYSLQLCTV